MQKLIISHVLEKKRDKNEREIEEEEKKYLQTLVYYKIRVRQIIQKTHHYSVNITKEREIKEEKRKL